MSNVDVDKAGVRDAIVFYVLKQFDQELVEKYLERSKDESFWKSWSIGDTSCRGLSAVGDGWFLAKLGLDDNSLYMQGLSRAKTGQTMDGLMPSQNHVDVLRTLVLLEPDSDYTERAVHHLIDVLELRGRDVIAVGILALAELDYERYQREINIGIDRLIEYKNEDGGFIGPITSDSDICQTSWAIQAISRIRGSHNSFVQEATNWLKLQQNDDGSWVHSLMHRFDNVECYSCVTADALLALISAGEGPKISLAEVEWKDMLRNQRIERTKPHFVHTSPIFDQRAHVKDIYIKIGDMLNSAETEIKILSPFIDVMYEDVVNLAENNPKLSIKIITRPSGDITGMRKRIGINALELLKIATRDKLRTNKILHARMIIVDGKEALISSADLTRDQLIDEFNAGIWVRDEETVKRATEFFDNIWEESEKKK
jgi:hypothetical protein